MLTETTVRELYELTFGADIEKDQIEYVFLQGWIRTNRAGKNVGFIALNDGTYFKNVQVVYLDEIIDNYEEALESIDDVRRSLFIGLIDKI